MRTPHPASLGTAISSETADLAVFVAVILPFPPYIRKASYTKDTSVPSHKSTDQPASDITALAADATPIMPQPPMMK